MKYFCWYLLINIVKEYYIGKIHYHLPTKTFHQCFHLYLLVFSSAYIISIISLVCRDDVSPAHNLIQCRSTLSSSHIKLAMLEIKRNASWEMFSAIILTIFCTLFIQVSVFVTLKMYGIHIYDNKI